VPADVSQEELEAVGGAAGLGDVEIHLRVRSLLLFIFGARPDLEPDPVENWRKRFDAIPTALNRVITKKLTKDYQSDVSLVIYVNLGCYGAYVSEGVPILCEGASLAKDKFKRVFVFWEGNFYKFWEDGKDVFEKWQYARLDDF